MSKEVPIFSSKAKSIRAGSLYEHYKGPIYKIIALAHHSETLEELVVYHPLNDKDSIWVRPVSMFLENMTVNGQDLPRFQLLK